MTQNQNDLQCENPVKFSPSVRLFALSFVQLPLYPFVRDFLSENTVRNFLIRFIKVSSNLKSVGAGIFEENLVHGFSGQKVQKQDFSSLMKKSTSTFFFS